MLALRKSKNKFIIIVNPSIYRDINENHLVGGLAHEMIHLEDYKKMNFFEHIIFIFLYSCFKSYRAKVERLTDIETILNGYGTHLLKNRQYRIENSSKKDIERAKKIYLFPVEIKEIVNKLKNKHIK